MNTNLVWRVTARENRLNQSIFVLAEDFEVFPGLEEEVNGDLTGLFRVEMDEVVVKMKGDITFVMKD